MLYIILMHISHFIFFPNDLLLAVYFIFILDYRNVRKKQIQAILFEFKMGHKAAETTHNINNTFGPGTANGRPAQWWFKKFCKGDESLEDEEHSGRSLEVGNDQLRAPSKLILLQLHDKLPKNSASTILWSFSI